jgi:hypothetical protein
MIEPDRTRIAPVRSGLEAREEASVPAQLESPGSGKRLAENQAGSVVESFEGLRVEVVYRVLLAPGLGRRGVRRPPSHGVLAENSVQPAARDEFRVLGGVTHRLLLSWVY